jgi:hypothetical protein
MMEMLLLALPADASSTDAWRAVPLLDGAADLLCNNMSAKEKTQRCQLPQSPQDDRGYGNKSET